MSTFQNTQTAQIALHSAKKISSTERTPHKQPKHALQYISSSWRRLRVCSCLVGIMTYTQDLYYLSTVFSQVSKSKTSLVSHHHSNNLPSSPISRLLLPSVQTAM